MEIVDILPFVLLVLFFFVFAWAATRLRRKGGTMTTTMHGALDSFYNKEKKDGVILKLVEI